jgi:hypothetical protein
MACCQVIAGISPSVGTVGDSYDNALAETINGLYKAEVIHRRGPWRNFEAMEFATLAWVDWFNNRRLLEPIGNIPPAEAEERYYAMLDAPAMAAYLNQTVSGKSGAVHKGQKRDPPCPNVCRAQAELYRAALLARGYFVSTVGRDEVAIRQYIRNQEKEI